MFKLDLEKAEEPEIKLPTSVGSLKKQDSSRNDYAKALVKEESEKVDLKLNIQKTKIMASGPITSWQIDWGNSGNSDRLLFLGAPKSLQMVTANMKLIDVAPWKKWYDQPRQSIKKQRHYFAKKGLSSQSYGFSSSHVWM